MTSDSAQEELSALLARQSKLLRKIDKIEDEIKKLPPTLTEGSECGSPGSRSEKLREEVVKARNIVESDQSSKIFTPRSRCGENPAPVPVEAGEDDEEHEEQETSILPESAQIGQVSPHELDQWFDVVIIGGGPAGVSACMKASFLGQRAIVVDKPKLPPLSSGLDVSFGGPTGLWSKALRDTAKTLDVKVLRGMKISDRTIWSQIVESSLKLARNNAENQVNTLLEAKQLYLQATARVLSPNLVSCNCLDGQVVELKTKNVLVATGSYPLRLPTLPVDDKRIFDADSVNKLTYLPRSVVVIGSGIIAFEYAMIFRKFGAKVTLLARDQVVNGCHRLGIDSDIAANLVDAMKQAGVQIFEGCQATSFLVPPGDHPEGIREPIIASLTWTRKPGPSSIKCDMCLAAVGRVPCVKGFGLEELNVNFHARGHILVDAHFCTSTPGIYAVGDAIGPPSLASTGAHQGQTAVEMMFQEHLDVTPMPPFPVGMWTLPEASYFGLTKDAAMKKGIDAEEGIASYDACLRGRVFSAEGMLKLVFRKADGVIIGVFCIGADACEIMHYGMDLVNHSVSVFEVMSTLYIAVTYHELYKAAATNGNSKLDFSLAFRSLASELGASVFDLKDPDSINIDLAKKKFDEVDKDCSGDLNADEIMQVFNEMGKFPQKSTILNLIRVSDVDKSGTIDWDEFKRLFVLLKAVAGKKPNAPRLRSKPAPDSTFKVPAAVAAFAVGPPRPQVPCFKIEEETKLAGA